MSAYDTYTDIAGPLILPATGDPTVRYRRVLTPRQRMALCVLVILNLVVSVTFVVWLLSPGHLPVNQGGPWSVARGAGLVAFVILISIEVIRLVQNSTLWVFASRMRDPVPMAPPSGLRVAVLTTIVPSKEPLDVLAGTVRDMKRIEYDGRVDVWVLDEGDDPRVRNMARDLGARHFTRKGRPEYNQPSGPFRAKTKAGNHNAWRAEHEGDYDIVAQMDPDHRPLPAFLNRTLGYFRDPDVAFVVAPQAYGNAEESFVAAGAADQSFMFHGVIQRGANGLDAPLLIGTNHLYRVEAWAQIGGYQDSVIEDHFTSLRVHTATNPQTGRRWKGVYTPDILAVGEGPVTWTDYFNQQKRWAYGVWDVVLRHSSSLLPQLGWRQRYSYAALQFFYPSVGAIWALGSILTGLYLIFGVTAIFLDAAEWALLWGATAAGQLALVVWLRRFNLAEHERDTFGLVGQALSVFASPIYAAAGVSALSRRTLQYVVTAKGTLASRDCLATFHLHAAWAVGAMAALAVSSLAGHTYWVLRLWGLFTAVAAGVPLLMFWQTCRRYQEALWLARGRRVTEAYFAPVAAARRPAMRLATSSSGSRTFHSPAA